MEKFIVSPAPHVYYGASTRRIMLDVCIALLPACAVAVYLFGANALLLLAVSVVSAVVAEALTQRILKKTVTVNDLSAVVTGLLVAMNVPPNAPWWLPVVGSAFAIVVAKQLYGGLGYNFINPALVARAVLLASWPVRMTSFVMPGVDAVTAATPLAAEGAAGIMPSYMDMFLGNIGGSLGEVSKAALLVGALYLLVRGVISWRIPTAFLLTAAVLSWVLGKDGLFTGDALFTLLSGGLVLGAFFMATDYATSPSTPKGQLIFGLGCGIITVVIRNYGAYPEGVSYSILLMNVASPLIERWTKPRIYGEVPKHA